MVPKQHLADSISVRGSVSEVNDFLVSQFSFNTFCGFFVTIYVTHELSTSFILSLVKEISDTRGQ